MADNPVNPAVRRLAVPMPADSRKVFGHEGGRLKPTTGPLTGVAPLR